MQNTSTEEQTELLTVPEAAKRLRLHPTTVIKMCQSGHLGAFRAGNGRGRWRIPAASLDAYNAARSPQPAVVAAA